MRIILGVAPALLRGSLRIRRDVYRKLEAIGAIHKVVSKKGDKGIDGYGVYKMELLSFPVFFQCKRYRGSVDPSAVRDFRGAMVGRADKGLIITTASFTADARKEATRDGAPAIDLIDGEALCALLKDLKLGVRVQLVQEIEIDETFFKSI